MGSLFWWVIFPYVCLGVMFLGLLYRYAFRQLTWTAPSTEFFEKRWLRIGSNMLHYGIIVAFIGHVMGIVVPVEFYEAIGVGSELYHAGAFVGGGITGIVVIMGIVILLIRKTKVDPIRVQASFADFFTLFALLFVTASGTYLTIVYTLQHGAYQYGTTIGPWFRSLFVFQPEYEMMAGIPLLFQLHALLGFALFAMIPFTHLVHFVTVPLRYLGRAPQQYRSRSEYKR